MDMKKLFPAKKTECAVTGPWVIEEISNGLKAKSMKLLGGMLTIRNKKISVQYFEFARIYGQDAFREEGILKVMEMFDELKAVTPKTIGYVFKDNSYINFKRGILKRNNKTGEENFYSEETLRNENISNYLQLSCSTDPLDEKTDTDREEIHNQCTDLQSSTSSR